MVSYYEDIRVPKSLTPRQRVDFLMDVRDNGTNMLNKYLSACLDSISWRSNGFVSFPLNYAGLSGFIADWIRQNTAFGKKYFLDFWYDMKTEENHERLPFLSRSCDYDHHGKNKTTKNGIVICDGNAFSGGFLFPCGKSLQEPYIVLPLEEMLIRFGYDATSAETRQSDVQLHDKVILPMTVLRLAKLTERWYGQSPDGSAPVSARESIEVSGKYSYSPPDGFALTSLRVTDKTLVP